MRFKKYQVIIQQMMDFEISENTPEPEKEILSSIKEHIPWSSFGSCDGENWVVGETRGSVKILDIRFVGTKKYTEEE